MLIATLGSTATRDLGLARAENLAEDADRLVFGDYEPLVGLLQETPTGQIVPVLVEKLRGGTPLDKLVGAAALANARTFGGEDYVGFHTMMALSPALSMSRELPSERQALPIIKVLYRNSNRINEFGGPSKEVLKAVSAGDDCCADGETFRATVRTKDMDAAERAFAALAGCGTAEELFNALLFAVQDNTEVHRTVLPYRAWDMVGVLGAEHAHTLLRQSVRYCVKSERDWRHDPETDRARTMLPKLLEKHGLVSKTLGTRAADDAWVEGLGKTIFEGSPEHAAEAAAAALAEGFSPDAVGEAISLATNQLVLRDKGRSKGEVQPGKPEGSVHGDSIGVHACDSANAWRNMARASNPRNAAACLILGAYQAAYDRVNRGGDFLTWQPRPSAEEVRAASEAAGGKLLNALEEAIRGNDQSRACALAQAFDPTEENARDMFGLLLKYAISEDGALHAEKFYRTAREEFAANRPAFRWRQLVALARVTASEYGRPAPGYREACELLRLS
jgi:hypothetical protein